MRLIDADALKLTHCLECVGYDEDNAVCAVSYCDIGGVIHLEEAPTVEAVPVEWLKSKCEEHKTDGYGWVYTAVIEDWRLEHGILETTRNCSKRGNGDPNGFNDETVQALKDTTERKNLSKVYETLDDMYADMGVSEWREYIYRVRETADGIDSDCMAELIRCEKCKRWNTKDGMFKDIDERQWHECPYLGVPTDEWFFCRDAKRREDER